MNTELSALEKAVFEVDVDQLPEILGELERVKMLAWQRVIRSSLAQGTKDHKQEGLLTVPQTALRLNIPESRAYELTRRQGGLPVIRIGKYLRVDPVSLERWLSEQEKTQLDNIVSVTYTARHGRNRTTKNPEETRPDARAISRTVGSPLELDRAAGARRDRHSRITSPTRPAVGED